MTNWSSTDTRLIVDLGRFADEGRTVRSRRLAGDRGSGRRTIVEASS
jgi:hypothetical protein